MISALVCGGWWGTHAGVGRCPAVTTDGLRGRRDAEGVRNHVQQLNKDRKYDTLSDGNIVSVAMWRRHFCARFTRGKHTAMTLNYFARAHMTNYPRQSGSERRHFFLLVLQAGGWRLRPRDGQGWLLPRPHRHGGNRLPPVSSHRRPSGCVCVPISCSYKDPSPVGSRPPW